MRREIGFVGFGGGKRTLVQSSYGFARLGSGWRAAVIRNKLDCLGNSLVLRLEIIAHYQAVAGIVCGHPRDGLIKQTVKQPPHVLASNIRLRAIGDDDVTDVSGRTKAFFTSVYLLFDLTAEILRRCVPVKKRNEQGMFHLL